VECRENSRASRLGSFRSHFGAIFRSRTNLHWRGIRRERWQIRPRFGGARRIRITRQDRRLDQHPAIGTLDKQIEASATEVALARQSYKPDYSVEVYYAYRRDFSDFIGVQFSVALPYFTSDRQDRGLAAALQQSRASEERKRDLLRELHTQVSQDFLDRRHFEERGAEFDASIIPDAQRRVDAARSAYQAGRGDFDAVLLARRGLLDVQLQRLALAVEAARSQVRLEYWSASQTSSGDAP